jgi:signal peptidase I
MMAGTPQDRTPRAAGAAGSGAPQSTAGGKLAPAVGSPDRNAWKEFVKSIAGALIVFLFIRTFLIEAYRIPSGSMEPTLLVGDWLFVNNLVYGPHVAFTSWHLPGYAVPKRRDVVVFVSPPQIDAPDDPTPILVKRMWGTPGDTIYMRNGVLFINGDSLPQGREFANNMVPSDSSNLAHSPLFDWQRRYSLTGSRFGAAPLDPSLDNWGPMVVPPDHYFMMGDNRYNSKDSRYWGFVPRENLRGRPLFVYYSYDPEAGLPYFRAVTEIRWSRLGHWIH